MDLILSGGEISEFNYFFRPKNNLKKLWETWKVLLVFNYIVHYQSKKQLLWNQTLHIWQTWILMNCYRQTTFTRKRAFSQISQRQTFGGSFCWKCIVCYAWSNRRVSKMLSFFLNWASKVSMAEEDSIIFDPFIISIIYLIIHKR